uniref:Uncharacterized protein n=1 Tax=Paraburkholderia sprentiae WSM5005 TaxID=754502 RepID=A0A1I9YEU3_9BURK
MTRDRWGASKRRTAVRDTQRRFFSCARGGIGITQHQGRAKTRAGLFARPSPRCDRDANACARVLLRAPVSSAQFADERA